MENADSDIYSVKERWIDGKGKETDFDKIRFYIKAGNFVNS